MLEGNDVRAAAARLRSGRKRRPCHGRAGGEKQAGGGGARLLPAPRARYRWSRPAGGSGEGGTEMAAATWELAEEEEEGQGFPSGPPALGGGGRLHREAPAAPEGGLCRG